jgi:hypothetical protein
VRLLLHEPKEQFSMIIRCHHLRDAGIMTYNCCSHCHLYAGCCLHKLPDGHTAILCCARIDPFTSEETDIILAKIPEWQVQEKDKEEAQASIPVIPDRFRPAYEAIQRLEKHERYLAALIYGSVAYDESTEYSDLFALIIVNGKNTCRLKINQVIIGDARLNLTFLSLEQLIEKTYAEIEKHERTQQLTIAESIIVFDKQGRTRYMHEEAKQLLPSKPSLNQQRVLQSKLIYYNDKVKSSINDNPLSALLMMNVSLTQFLSTHYQLHQHWRVSSHNLLTDLQNWDRDIVSLLENFMMTSNIQIKFRYWLGIIEHVSRSFDDSRSISTYACRCSICQKDLAMLQI